MFNIFASPNSTLKEPRQFADFSVRHEKIENIFCISVEHTTQVVLCSPLFFCVFFFFVFFIFFFASGSFKSVQAGQFIKPSQLTHINLIPSVHFHRQNQLLYSVSSACDPCSITPHTEEHSTKTQKELHSLVFFPTKSAYETTDRHLHGHLSVLRAGGPQHILLQDQKDLCHATQLRAKHAQRADASKVTVSNPLPSGLILGIEGLVAG